MARRFEGIGRRQTGEHSKEARRNLSKNGRDVDRGEGTEHSERKRSCRCETLSSFIWRPTKRDPRNQAARSGIDPSLRHANCRVVVMAKGGIDGGKEEWIAWESD